MGNNAFGEEGRGFRPEYGQKSPEHPEIGLCEKTIYNYIDCGALTAKNIDLPKKVTYKVRKSGNAANDDRTIFENRLYKDFQSLLSEYPDIRIVEMDTVIGCKK